MSGVFKKSLISATNDDLQSHARESVVRQDSYAIEGVQHRVSILRVREGRIIEQSARLSGC